MGVIGQFFAMVFGGGRNLVKETVEVFRENVEAGAIRGHTIQLASMAQHGAEFARQDRGWFDRLMDGVNRLPRPLLALGTLTLMVSALVDPLWFAQRMQGLALVPEPLWWLLGVIVSFYFGARHQVKAQEFQRGLAESVALAPQVVENIQALEELRHNSPGAADPGTDAAASVEASEPAENPALEQWRKG